MGKKPRPKNQKFEDVMNWIGESSERIHNEMMVGKWTPENPERIRETIRNRRVCIHEGRIFVPTLEEIKDHSYKVIEDVPISQWGLDLDHPDLKTNRKKIIENLKVLAGHNLFLEDQTDPYGSSNSDIFKMDWNMFDSKRFTKYYSHDDY
jgi:hypothetical protein